MTRSSEYTEEALVKALSEVLLNEDVDGLDDDLIQYIGGMLAAKVQEEDFHMSDPQESIDEVLMPFLESIDCPQNLVEKAEKSVLRTLESFSSSDIPQTVTTTGNQVQKLKQGMVSMSSDLSQNANEAEAMEYLWSGDKTVKAMANSVIDSYKDKSSAKEKRKQRKLDAERERKALSSKNDEDIDQEGGSGLVKMNMATFQTGQGADRKMDVNVKGITIALDNGTCLLESGDLKFAYQRRYGLIGENGVGKSTLLKHIARNEIEDFPKHLRVLHVRQEVPSHVSEELSVTEIVIQSDIERTSLLQREKDLRKKLEGSDDSDTNLSLEEKRKRILEASNNASQMQEMADDLKELDEVYARLQIISSDSAESRAAMILSGLQFTPKMQASRLADLSGGWKMRTALASALFIEPDILMLDEPTNHLDLEAVLWLESYLTTYKHTLLVVSHDRGFLNEVCTDIVEFKKRKLSYYRGNFDRYVQLRDENTLNQQRQYNAYSEKRAHMMEFIDKFRANAKRASMVQSRIKAVEKMDAEAPEAVEVDSVWRFSIPNSEPVGPPIIAINDVSFDYNPETKSKDSFLLQDVNFGVSLTSKIAILGANGQGKTTLLNLIMGKLRPTSGNVSIHQNLRIGHFTQHSADNFNLKQSALENMLQMFDEADDLEMRSHLGKFQIQGNDALKPMMLLSGGQKSRVAFAALAYKKPHVLIIDEGSNHLSMEAVDALIDAMNSFSGGICVVSHDQHFVSNTCTELWVVHDGKATRFRGDFDDYKQYTTKLTSKRVEESVKRLGAMSN